MFNKSLLKQIRNLILLSFPTWQSEFCLFFLLSPCSLVLASADPIRLAIVQGVDAHNLSARPDTSGSSEDYQFGTINALQTSPIEHTFTLRNDNSAPVTLDHLQPSCGCTTAVIGGEAGKTGHVIAPGKTVQVHVSVDPSHLSAGAITKSVWVYVQGQSDPVATLQIIGTMQPAVTFSPTFLDFGKVPHGGTPSRLLTMTLDPQLASATAPQLSLSNPDIIVTQEKVSTKRSGDVGMSESSRSNGAKATVFTYRFTLSAQARLGQMSGIIALTPPRDGTVQPPALQAVSVPIVGEIVGELSASPSAVAFGTITQGQSATQQLILTAISTDALRNISVRSLTPSISVSLSKTPVHLPNSGVQSLTSLQRVLTVTAGPASTTGSLQTQIIVTTGHNQELVLPVFLSVIAPGTP